MSTLKTTNIKQRKLVEALSEDEVIRRRKQKQTDKKNNPKKKSKNKLKKEQSKENRLQVQFLYEMRLANQVGMVHEVLTKYTEQFDEKTVQRLLKRCNIIHWT